VIIRFNRLSVRQRDAPTLSRICAAQNYSGVMCELIHG
jgi:hypothetical protein